MESVAALASDDSFPALAEEYLAAHNRLQRCKDDLTRAQSALENSQNLADRAEKFLASNKFLHTKARRTAVVKDQVVMLSRQSDNSLHIEVTEAETRK